MVASSSPPTRVCITIMSVQMVWDIGRVKSQVLAAPFRWPRYSRTLSAFRCLKHRKLLRLTRTFCVVTVTAFILVSISGSIELFPMQLLLRMVLRTLGQQSHSCSAIPDESWLYGFRLQSLYLSHFARNRS